MIDYKIASLIYTTSIGQTGLSSLDRITSLGEGNIHNSKMLFGMCHTGPPFFCYQNI